ncbi:MAG TPA: hypothetical protein VK641_00840 [Terriglobales bacterium]|nr:hypothetical protein [Terriglobales bacterium]
MNNGTGVLTAVGAKLGLGLLILLVSACAPGALRTPGVQPKILAPYPHSPLISTVTWDSSGITAQRKARGSDLWPCAWAADGDLYCAWGDGGGFDGNDDNIGRVSLGFARVRGTPNALDPSAVSGKNIWGAPPYAEVAAGFGGKVGSIAAVKGVLYAIGGFWTGTDTEDPIHKSGRGPRSSIARSTDSARSWQIADWSSRMPLGSFIDVGQDTQDAAGGSPPYVYLYFQRDGDTHHLYLKRIHPELLMADPITGRSFEYFKGTSWFSQGARWSAREEDAIAVFTDGNNVQGPSAVYDAPLRRYLLTTGHYASGNDDDSSAGQVGIFEAKNPWGPWRTIAYYEDWAGLKAETSGDFLSLRIPSKWIGADGKTLWAVFSGLKSFDSFNLIRGTLELR